MENTEVRQIALDYENATKQFLAAVAKLATADLDKPKQDGWSARQVIHHLADGEAQGCARLKRILAEPGSIIQGYDENKWAANKTLGYAQLPIENAIALFTASRASALEIINRLVDEQLTKSAIHSESGPIDIRKWAKNHINHALDHTQQLLAD